MNKNEAILVDHKKNMTKQGEIHTRMLRNTSSGTGSKPFQNQALAPTRSSLIIPP